MIDAFDFKLEEEKYAFSKSFHNFDTSMMLTDGGSMFTLLSFVKTASFAFDSPKEGFELLEESFASLQQLKDLQAVSLFDGIIL